MSQTKTPEEQVKELQAQVTLLTSQAGLLTSQQQLITAQIALQVAQQTNQTLIDKGTLDNLKALVVAQVGLDKAKAAAPFAELQGLKEGLASVAVAGKEGVLTLAKGTDGALLLRVKKELLLTLDAAAEHILAILPKDSTQFVLATDADLLAAHKGGIWTKRFELQEKNLQSAITAAPLLPKPAKAPDGAGPAVAPAMALGPALAAVQTVPFVLNALSDAAKFFRVDRTVSLFDGSDEAHRILETLIEGRAHASQLPARVTRIDGLSADVTKHATQLLDRLDVLAKLHQRGIAHAGLLQRASEAAAKSGLGPQDAGLPNPEAVADLQGELAATKQLLDAFNPNGAPETFWAQVSALVRQDRMKDKGRIHLIVNAQTVQTLEKRTWRSDRLIGSGEVQIEYRITDAAGNYMRSGLRAYTSATRNVFDDDRAQEVDLPDFSRK